MKIITLHKNEKSWIKKAVAGDPRACRTIYENYASKMLSVCRQYIRDLQFAEDAMVSGFTKVFQNLGSFEHRGSFEGWVRRIMVRECISFLRKRQFVVFDDEVYEAQYAEAKTSSGIWEDDIQQQIDALPQGYKMVFLLYAVEGYKHHEIADMLKISEGTSKSQLFKARKMLQEGLKLKGISSSSKFGGS
ncbi:RNA polymerase sigma factor [Flagellimonas allohymeniacidonis]|uniref:RNA polymerase sigma factor n=1 Tax=Flagellimonas allohymeniacidonis TaxID=2517819 RepID=A0A4Q8Q9F2_9FLAO|nr:RNA polymerase sigma factor [Allomuricauda hymeniacidonis]TAI46892.1 RNA polymerase sigma factor [Allomuricauda hymeniacidonis]